MKKLLLAFVLLIGVSSLNNTAEAQNVNVNINVGNQPSWGPVGYDYVDYYYFPDIDCYYDVNIGMYHFYERGRWVSARYLPYAYRNYDLYGLYKVVLNVNNPWMYNRVHRRDYSRYVGYRNQGVIRDSRDHRYSRSRQNNVVWYSGSSRANNSHVSRPNNGRPNNSHVSRPNNGRPNNNNVSRPNNNNGSNHRPNSNGNVSRPNNNNNNSNSSRPNNNSNNGGNTSRPNSNGGNSNVSRPNSNSNNSGSNVSRPSNRPSRDSGSSTRSSGSSSNGRSTSNTRSTRSI